MRLVFLFAAATYIALIIQTAVPLWFPTRALIPNLIVILVVDLGLRHHGALPAILAFAIGYATDAFAGTHLGLNAFLTTLVFLLTYEASSRLLVTNALVGAIAVFFAAIVAGLGAVAIVAGRGAGAAANSVLPAVLLQALISAIISPIVFAMLEGSKRVIGLPDRLERE